MFGASGLRWPSRFSRGMAAAVVLSVVFRIRFLFVPITTDEGGYLAVARAWRHGATPYVDAWVDRPIGLWVLFAAFDAVVGDAHLVRLLAVLFGAIGVVAVGWAVRCVASDRAAVAAAVATAVATSGPTIEGYAANGELLSGSVGAVSVALACAVLVGRLRPRWMVVAGVTAGLAWSLKQSGVDGPAAVCLWLAFAAVLRWMPWRVAVARLGAFVGGGVAVFGLVALHGISVGASNWWYGIVGYRMEQRNVLRGGNWDNLRATLGDALPVLLPAVVLALVCAGVAAWRRWPLAEHRAAGVMAVWPFTAMLTFAMGGQFFRHYWVTLAFPAAALAGLLMGAVKPVGTRLAMAALIGYAAVPWANLAFLPASQVPIEAGDGPRLNAALAVGEWLHDHKEPGDTVYVMCAAANVYAYAEADPPYRYLWFDGVHKARDSREMLVAMFRDDPPTWVALFDRPSNCVSDPLVADVVAERYERVVTLKGVAVLRLSG